MVYFMFILTFGGIRTESPLNQGTVYNDQRSWASSPTCRTVLKKKNNVVLSVDRMWDIFTQALKLRITFSKG